MSNPFIRSEKPSEAARTSAVLRHLDSETSGPVLLGTVLASLGSRVHGVALLLLSLPDTLPLPIPSTSTILGVPLVLIAAHLVVYGEGSGVPERAKRLEILRPLIHGLARYAAPVLEVLEKVSRPRLIGMLRSDRMLGLICLYLAVILLLPIPLMNAAPALCLVAISLGMIQRDGLFVAAGIVGVVVVTAGLGFVADWINEFFQRQASHGTSVDSMAGFPWSA